MAIVDMLPVVMAVSAAFIYGVIKYKCKKRYDQDSDEDYEIVGKVKRD